MENPVVIPFYTACKIAELLDRVANPIPLVTRSDLDARGLLCELLEAMRAE